jgi:hypothetical protein
MAGKVPLKTRPPPLSAKARWNAFGKKHLGQSAIFFPKELVAPVTCMGLRDPDEFDKWPQWYLFYHHLSLTEINPGVETGLERIWTGVPLNGDPPKNFRSDLRRSNKRGCLGYIIVPACGLRVTSTRGSPTLSASDVQELARLNGRKVAQPGKDQVFQERPSIEEDGDGLDFSYFVTPSLFL